MLTLALDTSAVSSSCCIYGESGCISRFDLNSKTTHSKTALPMIDAMLDCAGCGIEDIDMFAVSTGPGSFTGVRIGVSAVAGLAFGKKCAVGVSTLEAAAYNLTEIPGDFLICPVMDARRGQLYCAVFKPGPTPQRLTPDMAISAEEFESILKGFSLPCMFTGDGIRVARELIRSVPVISTPKQLALQNAVGVARAARNIYLHTDDKSLFDPKNLKPTYLRPSQAERNLNNTNTERK